MQKENKVLTALLWGLFTVTVACVIYWMYVNDIGRQYINLAAAVFIASLVIVLALNIAVIKYRRYKYLSSTLREIDEMDGREFEMFLKVYFESLGYKVSLTQDSHDYGADLICSCQDEILVVQAKRYDTNVGIAAVQQVIGARVYYEADRSMVVTNAYFTKPAIDLAESNDVELWDRDDLEKRV